MSEYVIGILGIIGIGFFWRWIDRVDKKIDNLLDYFKDMASKSELKELKTDLKLETDELFRRIHEIEQKYNGCINCKSK